MYAPHRGAKVFVFPQLIRNNLQATLFGEVVFHSVHKFDTFELKAIKKNDIRKKRGLPSSLPRLLHAFTQ